MLQQSPQRTQDCKQDSFSATKAPLGMPLFSLLCKGANFNHIITMTADNEDGPVYICSIKNLGNSGHRKSVLHLKLNVVDFYLSLNKCMALN